VPRAACDFDALTRAHELALIDAALAACQHHQGRAAAWLGLSYHRFRALWRKYGYGSEGMADAAAIPSSPVSE
jgi:psp operon transcriptional activator